MWGRSYNNVTLWENKKEVEQFLGCNLTLLSEFKFSKIIIIIMIKKN